MAASAFSTGTAAPTASHGPLASAEHAAPPQSSAHTGIGMRCPDPSVHQAKSSVLQNQASAAALYSTDPARASQPRSTNPLGSDGKLSSASAATSLKYAKAQDLPGFPVVGIDTKSSAGAAALLANRNQKSPEWWKPEQSAAAGKAALLANNYKMAPLWQPEASAAGSQAAMLAHRDGAKLNLWAPEASIEGNSAATIAMRKKSPGPLVDHGRANDRTNTAFVAATGAHSSSRRKRAHSNPAPAPLYPDSKNSAKNALSAATLAHSPSVKAKPQTTTASDSNRLGHGAMEAARIQHAKSISRDMYTSAPPVALEVDERRHNDALRASAISMAKKIYDMQQQPSDGPVGPSAARTGATAAHSQQPVSSDADIKQQAMQYIGIQEAAQKLAHERLAKIGYDENAAYRSYYGYNQASRSKLSMRRGRPRAHSASEKQAAHESDSDEDDFRSRRIRSQMEQFNKELADVDAKKRDNDRKALLAAAQRKVQAQMQGMDKKIFDETGKMSQGMIDDWDEKAKKRAVANSEARMENHGRVHIGNGKWMDQSEIDAIALARIQPTLDEITEKTEKRLAEDEKRRAEEEERRLDLEEKKRRDRIDKERAAELKAEEKQLRDEEKRAAKSRAAEDKLVAKQEKELEKSKKAEESRIAREENRKSREAPVATPGAIVEHTGVHPETTTLQTTAHHEQESTDPTSPTSPGSSKGLKSLIGKLKRRSKHNPNANTEEMPQDREAGFIGGAALRSSTSQPTSHSSQPTNQPQHESTVSNIPNDLGDVEPTSSSRAHATSHSDVSSLSSDDFEDVSADRGRSAERIVSGGTGKSNGTDFEEARDHFDTDLAPPPTFTSDAEKARKGSPTRDSKFHEVGL